MENHRMTPLVNAITQVFRVLGLGILFGMILIATAQGQASRRPPSIDGSGNSTPSRPLNPGLSGSADLPPTASGLPGDQSSSEISSQRYRFVESYVNSEPEQTNDTKIGPYRVAFSESIDQRIETGGSEPLQSRRNHLVRYVALPALISGLDQERVDALIRRYDLVKVKSENPADEKPVGAAGLRGRELWFGKGPGATPFVQTLPGNPPLTQQQFEFVAFRQVSVPELNRIFPGGYIGVGTTWSLDASGANPSNRAGPIAAGTLLGSPVLDGNLNCRFERVELVDEEGTLQRAIISLQGRFTLVGSVVAELIGEIQFTFRVDQEVAGNQRLQMFRTISAQGAITKLLLAERAIKTIPGPDGNPSRATRVRQLVLERRPNLGEALEPTRLTEAPRPTPLNSFVIYRDPEDRFQFRHPQGYRPAPVIPATELESAPFKGSQIHMQRRRIAGNLDDLQLLYLQPDPNNVPEFETFADEQVARWSESGVTVGEVTRGFLPDADWPDRRVYRLVIPMVFDSNAVAQGGGQAYAFSYLVQYNDGPTLQLGSLTGGEPNFFRDEVEEILRSVELNPPPLPSVGF